MVRHPGIYEELLMNKCDDDPLCELSHDFQKPRHWAKGLSWRLARLFDNRAWRYRIDDTGRPYQHIP